MIRPRNEEQFEIIQKFVKKIIYETQNIDKDFTTSYEEEELG